MGMGELCNAELINEVCNRKYEQAVRLACLAREILDTPCSDFYTKKAVLLCTMNLVVLVRANCGVLQWEQRNCVSCTDNSEWVHGFEALLEMSRSGLSEVPAEQSLFQAFPPHITFQGYEPGKTYEQRIAFRNNDKVIKGF